jgi:hypothetical protein
LAEDVRVYTRALSPNELETIFAAQGVDGIASGLHFKWGLNENAPGVTVPVSGNPIRSLSNELANGNAGGTVPTWVEGELRTKRKMVA